MGVRILRHCPIWIFTAIIAIAASSFPSASLGDVAYIIRSPAGQRDVEITFSYDPQAELDVLGKVGGDGRVLLWQIQCTKKYFFFRPFNFTQDDHVSRPVLCLVKKYLCDDGSPEKGYVYQGYLYLDRDYDLTKPMVVTLADKAVEATFIQ
ncbi:MAG: hypothetical protein GXP52_03195 [Deltaproteobacteria bacterium]|nr:hypothetical protein [Deltaproteobacteria bacterium]